MYGDDYEKFEVVTITFESLVLGIEWNILAIDQTFGVNHAHNVDNDAIIIYAAHKDQLQIKLLGLMVDDMANGGEQDNGMNYEQFSR